MEITEQNLINICGEQPEGVNYIDPGNDPNFVFVPDPEFDQLTLFNSDGTAINVNSWTECSHYVAGGWSGEIESLYNFEQTIFWILFGISIFYLTLKNFLARSKLYEK